MIKPKKLYLGDQEGLKIAESEENITQEELEWRIKELERCKNDINYFANTYFYVLNAIGDKIHIKLYPKQSELLYKICDNNRVICVASRQIGKTTAYVIICLYQIIFQKNFNILIAGNKGETARDNLAKIKEGFETLPNWMKPPITIWNETKIKFKNGVILKAVTTTGSTGRSGSIDMLILDEFAFVPKNVQEEFWKASLPTVSSRPKAKIIIISTPNGIGDKFHEVWQMATSGKTGEDGSVWIAHKIDWWERPDRDEKWYKRELASLGSKEAFDQEYGNSFTVTAGNKLIPDERQLELKNILKHYDYREVIHKVEPSNPDNDKTYSVYFPYIKGHTYVGAVDTAEGTGQDNSVLYIFDITYGRTIYLCAKFASAKVIPVEFAKIIYKICDNYGKPLLIIESNSIGSEVINTLYKTGILNTFTHTYEIYENIARFNRKNNLPGIFSHVQTKTKACLNAQKIIQNKNFTLILPDNELFKELTYFEKQVTAFQTIYRAARGKHDDFAITLIWGLFVYNEEILNKYFNVEYYSDEKLGETYPILITSNNNDLKEIKNEINKISNDEKVILASKWHELGDDNLSNYIMQTIFEDDFENNYGYWTSNPYQIDVSNFSDGLFGERYKGLGRQNNNITNSSDECGFVF